MATLFTADGHLGHYNVIKHCSRPFSSIEEHDEVQVINWNAVVNPNDTVWHLGDVGFRCSPKYLYRLLERLNGKIHLIVGNHDRKCALKTPAKERFETISSAQLLTIQEKGKTYRIYVHHYACRTWPGSNRGSWHLFGHSHGNLPPHGLSFDVGVDCWGFTPISMDTIAKKMGELKIALDYEKSENFVLKSGLKLYDDNGELED